GKNKLPSKATDQKQLPLKNLAPGNGSKAVDLKKSTGKPAKIGKASTTQTDLFADTAKEEKPIKGKARKSGAGEGKGKGKDDMAGVVKKLVALGKERGGFLTIDDINIALPPGQLSAEYIDSVIASLAEAGVHVSDKEDDLVDINEEQP